MPERRPSPGRGRRGSGEHRRPGHQGRSNPRVDVAWGSLDELWGPDGERSGDREAGEWPLDLWGANGVSLTGEPGAAMLVLEPETPAFAGTGSPSEPVAAVAEAPVIDLMEALRQSVADAQTRRSADGSKDGKAASKGGSRSRKTPAKKSA